MQISCNCYFLLLLQLFPHNCKFMCEFTSYSVIYHSMTYFLVIANLCLTVANFLLFVFFLFLEIISGNCEFLVIVTAVIATFSCNCHVVQIYISQWDLFSCHCKLISESCNFFFIFYHYI